MSTSISATTESQSISIVTVFDGVIGNMAQPVVDARELHTYLGSKQKFADWIKNRITKFSFEENQDFHRFHNSMKANNATITDYHLTLDTAKELSMVENNDQGRAARRYFIAMEKQALENIKAKFMPAIARVVISPEQKSNPESHCR